MKLLKMVADYKKNKTMDDSELKSIEEIIRNDREIKKILRLYESIAKPKDISKEEQEKLQFGSYQYSTGI